VSTLPQSQRVDARDGGRHSFRTAPPAERPRLDPLSEDTSAEGAKALTGATPEALIFYQRALLAFQRWRGGSEENLARALELAPRFVMAHALRAYLLLVGRDPRRVLAAKATLARAAALPANDVERRHLRAIGAAIADDYEQAKARLQQILARNPLDALALQVAHSCDYVTGDTACLEGRVANVLPAWSSGMPGYSAVLAMYAFSLEESGRYDEAEQAAREALAMDPNDARAHHVMAHVFEMTERAEDGERWLRDHFRSWGEDTLVARHCWWHLALFQLGLGKIDAAIRTYDERIRGDRSEEVADLVDASALLWRVALAGGDAGARWPELAAAWAPHIEDRFCSFSDMHVMLAFVGAGDEARALLLEQVLVASQSSPTRYGLTTRDIGLPACRGLMAFGHGDDARAIMLLGSLPALAHRLGGSHAQRDVLNLTLLRAVERTRRRW